MSEPAEGTGREILDLVSVALAQERRSGLSEMLRCVARAVDADGCILWQATPFSQANANPPTGQLFVLAEWFEGPRRCNLHDLSLQSVTGEAVLYRRSVGENDFKTNPRMDRRDSFFQDIECFCSVPITFLDGELGALNAYRRTPRGFEKSEIAKLEEIVKLLPSLYQTIVDKVSHRLVRTINRLLQEGEREPPQSEAAARFEEIAAQICQEIADSLQALEVSIFLEDRLENPGIYKLMATTLPKEVITKGSYRAYPEEGLTGWVLNCGKEVQIFDLARFDPSQTLIQEFYPGLQWKDSMQIEASVRILLNVPPEDNLQPLSFLAVPIVVSDRVLGVIRCCTIKEGPFYFADQEVKLLRLAAAQVGQAWSHWLSRREIEEENNALQRFVASIGELNRFVQYQVIQDTPDEKSIFRRALQVTSSVIHNAEITDVRLLDERHQELYFEATNGAAWDLGTPDQIRARLTRRFPITEGPPKSGGAYVVQTEQVYVIPDTSDPDSFYSETFPGTRRMIIAPIGIAGKIFGVLDIRGTGEREFSRHAIPIAELLGQQLGLYHYLLNTIAELQRLPRQLAQTFEDFTHQLKTPILQVHARARACLQIGSTSPIGSALQGHLLALRGLAAKARRATQSLGLFADLARGEVLRLQLRQLEESSLAKMLIESLIDQRSTLADERGIRMRLEADDFSVLQRHLVRVDPDLLFQAVNNLLDNAIKYSYEGTVVRIGGGLTGTGRFHISVINTGIPISAAEAKLCTWRGWRSELAQDVSGEGSGIGLWITKHIMEAHGGELIVIPTRNNMTEVKLVFPTESRHESSDSGR